MSGVDRMRVVTLWVGFAIVVSSLCAVTACRRDTQAAASTSDHRTMATQTVTVPVSGMICQVCAGSVKSALKKVDGVQDAEINLEMRNALIHYDERKVNVDQLTQAIKEAGYKPGLPTAAR